MELVGEAREIAFTLMVEAAGFLSKNNVVKLL
jgi:hypothetical protein